MDWLNKISHFLDKHIRLVTNAGYIIAAIGVISIARRSRLLTKFNSVSDIPSHFVEKRIKLRGQVCDVRMDNVVIIQHIPSFSFMRFGNKGSFAPPESGIRLGLAGVRLNTPGCVSLNKLLHDKVVWFELLSSQQPDAIIYLRKAGFLRNVNIQAVEQGFGVAALLNECDHPRLRTWMQRDLFKAQRYAARKTRGVWKN